MADCQITCISKSSVFADHSHITHVGNPAGGWMLTVEDAIRHIDTGLNTFFVRDLATGRRANVGVVREPGKRPYLRTHADGYWNDNLLSLDFCPLRRAA